MDREMEPQEAIDRARLKKIVEECSTPEFQRIIQRNRETLAAITGPLSFDCILAARQQEEADIARTVSAAVQVAFYQGYQIGRGVGPAPVRKTSLVIPSSLRLN